MNRVINQREVTYDVDGLTMVAYLARPDGDGPWPSVLVGHDGIGLEGYQPKTINVAAPITSLSTAM